MLKILILAFGFLLSFSHVKIMADVPKADVINCPDTLPSTLLMECEAIGEREAVEKEMQKALLDVAKKLRHPESKKYLDIAQLAWERYASSTCDYKTVRWMGGTSASSAASRCKTKYIRQRIEELNSYKECDTDDCP